MDENVVHHQILPQNCLVQSAENIPVSMIDHDGKVQVAQFIHPGPFYYRSVPFSEVNANPLLGQIHPFELGIQSDFQPCQQQQELSFSHQPTNSVIHVSTQTVEEVCADNSPKPVEMPNVMYDGTYIPLTTVPNINESIVNMDGLEVQDNMYYQPVIKQLIVDKGPYYVVPQAQVVFSNSLNDNQINVNDVPVIENQLRGTEEEEAMSFSNFNECDNNIENEETVTYSYLNEYGQITEEGGEEKEDQKDEVDEEEKDEENEQYEQDEQDEQNEQNEQNEQDEQEEQEEQVEEEDDNDDKEEEEVKEATPHSGLNIVDTNIIKEASAHTELSKCDTNSQKKKEEQAQSESESDENYVANSDYDSNLDDPQTPENATKPEKSPVCHICNKRFVHRKNMYVHVRKAHNIEPVIKGKILCPICKEQTTRERYLRNHLENAHEIQIEKEERLFNTLNDFLLWKAQVEKETLSLYVCKSSPKILATKEQKTYYKCHRSGSYALLTIRKKKLKEHGSNKMGATCPAAIQVTENKIGFNVVFWKTHVGHDLELSRLPLSKDEKAKIMDHLNGGSRVNEIVRHFKSESSKNPPTKLCLLTQQDVRNVKRDYKLECNSKEPKGNQEKMLNTPSSESVIEKADILWELLKTTDVKAEFRSKVCLMLDNLISLVKRRGERACRRESMSEGRKDWLKRNRSDIMDHDNQNRVKSQKTLRCQKKKTV